MVKAAPSLCSGNQISYNAAQTAEVGLEVPANNLGKPTFNACRIFFWAALGWGSLVTTSPFFLGAPGRAHSLGGGSPLHTRQGEVLAERQGCPSRGGILRKP